jgi:UDP-glucose 4-epimerase
LDEVLVTGGAGFLGSHLVEALLSSQLKVTVVDSLVSGKAENLRPYTSNTRFNFVKKDACHLGDTSLVFDCDTVFHLAADSDVRMSLTSPTLKFEQNVTATRMVLEAMRKARSCSKIVFSSSSTVYGDTDVFPTPESFGPLVPVSLYGAAKLACEALITAYCNSYGLEAVILRLANVVGPRAGHGVIPDFVSKLSRNPNKLEILGDGSQRKSYIHVTDAVGALLLGTQAFSSKVMILNVGSNDTLDVMSIARIVAKSLDLNDVEYVPTGGIDGGRGWPGDVKTMLLDTSRIEQLGWRPSMTSAEAVKTAARELAREIYIKPTPRA